MDYGYINVGAAVPHLKVADCIYNTDQILKQIEEASEKNLDILVFPELCITAYTCGDLFYQQTLITEAEKQLGRIIENTKERNMFILVSLPVYVDNQLFNCAIGLSKGKILGIIPKTYIPNNSEFYEKRWFASSISSVSKETVLCGQKAPFGTDLLFQAIDNPHVCIGVEICEDLWVTVPPSSFQCLHGATIILNPSASNDIVGKSEYRKTLVEQQSARCISGYIYTSCGYGESTTDVVFGGHAMIYETGSRLKESERFSMKPSIVYSQIDIERLIGDRRKASNFMGLTNSKLFHEMKFRKSSFSLEKKQPIKLTRAVNSFPFVPSNLQQRNIRCEEIFSIQTTGLAKRIAHVGAKTAVVGISGGLDSTLALLVCIKAFDQLGLERKNIIGITMPGFGTTDRTYNNALTLMEALGVSIREISIKEASLQHFKDIGHDPQKHDVTYENTQARERTQILMDVANQESGLVIGTGDLSELALGWATYNGDHMSMYAVNASVPKTLVRYLVQWIADHMVNKNAKNTLMDILDTPVSPELLPPTIDGEIDQKTEELVGPYELHDFFLFNVVRYSYSPQKIIYLAQHAFENKYNRETIIHWLYTFYKRFFSQQFKRSCLPDGPKVGSICLSPRGDWRMPSDASVRIWLDEITLLMNEIS